MKHLHTIFFLREYCLQRLIQRRAVYSLAARDFVCDGEGKSPLLAVTIDGSDGALVRAE